VLRSSVALEEFVTPVGSRKPPRNQGYRLALVDTKTSKAVQGSLDNIPIDLDTDRRLFSSRIMLASTEPP
jgi:hypothetical protein